MGSMTSGSTAYTPSAINPNDIAKSYENAVDQIFNQLSADINKILAGNALGNSALQSYASSAPTATSSLASKLKLNKF